MGIIAAMKRLTSVTPEELLKSALEEPLIESQIIDLNQKQLYEQGVESDGTPTGDYSLRTVNEKISAGEPYDHVTLKDTGDFYDSMKVELTDNSAVITGDMQKPDRDLEEGWPKALGLTEESLNEIKPDVWAGMLRAWKRAV